MVVMVVVHDDGARAQRRRRLRRACSTSATSRSTRPGRTSAGWLASQQFEQVTVHFGSTGPERRHRDPPLDVADPASSPACSRCVVGIVIGLPTLRLRGDYLAIVTLGFGEIVPQFVRNADSIGGFDLTHGTFGISPIDSLGVRRRSSSAIAVEQGRPLLLDRDRAAPVHRLLLRAAARLAARARLDRDPRGRDGGRGDGGAADAHEDVVVRDRRVLRRRRRARSTRASGRVPSRPTSTSTSPSSCSAWSSSAAWARSGACSSAA